MRQNSYPGESGQRRNRIVEQDGYTGKNYFSVVYGAQIVTVHAADTLADVRCHFKPLNGCLLQIHVYPSVS